MTFRTVLAAAFLAVAAVAGPVCAAEDNRPLPHGTYGGTVLRVIDGDTVAARLRMWLDTEITIHVRLRGIDAPELDAPCPTARAVARMARDRLEELLGAGAIIVSDVGRDPFAGRILARVATEAVPDVGVPLVNIGYAVPWDSEADWCVGLEGER